MSETTHKEERTKSKTEESIERAWRKFFRNLGVHSDNAAVFLIGKEIAKEFGLEFNGADASDLSFLREIRNERIIENIVRKRGPKKKRKYEQIPFSDLEARTP